MKIKNYSPCLMVQCIYSSNQDISTQIQHILESMIKRNWSHAQISLKSHTDYWKNKEEKKITYAVTNITEISVKEIIGLFNLTWHYTSGMVTDFYSHKSFTEESAVWSKTSSPQEVFLLSCVEWVHIYTWDTQ